DRLDPLRKFRQIGTVADHDHLDVGVVLLEHAGDRPAQFGGTGAHGEQDAGQRGRGHLRTAPFGSGLWGALRPGHSGTLCGWDDRGRYGFDFWMEEVRRTGWHLLDVRRNRLTKA